MKNNASLDHQSIANAKIMHTPRDGSTHVVLSPQVLIERLLALVPRPRRHKVPSCPEIGSRVPNTSYVTRYQVDN